MRLFHGGIRDLEVGDPLLPSDPHVQDGCPICEARAAGRVCTVGEYRAWLYRQGGPHADRVLRALAGVSPLAPMDPPSEVQAVYVTTDRRYARWYAARAGYGDLYRVVVDGALTPSRTDHFPSWTCARAIVVEVLERGVVLDRRFRRDLDRAWKKADTMAVKGGA